MEMNKNVIDDQVTTTEEARLLLESLCETGFNSDTEEIAGALGRDEDEILSMLDGSEDIDEDLLMKIHGIAQERNLKIE